MSLLKRLISLANGLDNRNFFDEASHIDNIIVRLAMSMEDARTLLGVSPNASEDEIQKAWRAKAIEHHPDRGGDEEMMKRVNIARDLLVGERKPDRTYTPPTSGPAHDYSKQYSKPKGNNVRKTSWEEAAKSAGIPDGVNWKFKTDNAYSAYLGEKKALGFVVYGTTEDSHVFVGVYHFRDQNPYDGTDIDEYKMWTSQESKSANLADLAPRVIRELWNNFDLVKGYNAKVSILPEGTPFAQSLSYSLGRSVSFKDAMSMMGEKSTTWSQSNKKMDVILELGRGEGFMDYSITLVVNGRPYQLSKENAEKLRKQSNLLKVVFGNYYYEDSKKHLTKIQKGKSVLEYLVKKLEGSEPEELIEALKKAAEQMEKK